MCKKVKPYLAYILAGALGLLTFIFSAFSGIVTVMKFLDTTWKSSESVYKFMDFTAGESALNSAGAFEILLIIISLALITFAVLGILNKLGKIKISLGKVSIEDLLIYIAFGYVAFALAQSISIGAFIGQKSSFFSDSAFITIGAGPLLMLFASAGLAAYQILVKWVFKDKSGVKTETKEEKPATVETEEEALTEEPAEEKPVVKVKIKKSSSQN